MIVLSMLDSWVIRNCSIFKFLILSMFKYFVQGSELFLQPEMSSKWSWEQVLFWQVFWFRNTFSEYAGVLTSNLLTELLLLEFMMVDVASENWNKAKFKELWRHDMVFFKNEIHSWTLLGRKEDSSAHQDHVAAILVLLGWT